MTANVAAPQRLWLPTARVDWQLGAKNTLIVSYTGNSSNLRNVGVGGQTLAEAGYDAQSYDHTARVVDVTTVSAHLMHEARASFRFFGQQETPLSSAPQVAVAGAFTGGGSADGPLHYKRFRMEVDDDFILTKKAHTVKGGTQFFLNNDHRTLTNNFNGSYTFGGGAAPVLGANNQPTGATANISGIEQYRRAQLGLAGGAATAFTVVTGDPQVNFVEVNNALFLQDDWKLPHGVMISSGLRWYTQTKPTFLDSLTTPRLGIQWAPGKDPKWTLHAHAGMFAAQTIPNEYAEVAREDGVHRVTSLVYNPVFLPNGGQPFAPGATVIRSERTFAQPLANVSYAFYNVAARAICRWALPCLPILAMGGCGITFGRTTYNAPLDGSPTGVRPFTPNLNIYQVQNSGQGRSAFEFFGLSNYKYKRANVFVGAVHLDQIDDTNDDTFFTPQNSRSDAGSLRGAATILRGRSFRISRSICRSRSRSAAILTRAATSPTTLRRGRITMATASLTIGRTLPRRARRARRKRATGCWSRRAGSRREPQQGVQPWRTYVDANLQRAFKVTRNSKAEHQQTLTANIRSSNLINHTNVTAVGGVFNSPLFGLPYAADNGRRIEAGLRYSF